MSTQEGSVAAPTAKNTTIDQLSDDTPIYKPRRNYKFTSQSVLQPPPDVRRIIDLTADRVAIMDPSFETGQIYRDKEGKVAFIQTEHMYNPYYRARLQYGQNIPQEILLVPEISNTQKIVSQEQIVQPNTNNIGISLISSPTNVVPKIDTTSPEDDTLYTKLMKEIHRTNIILPSDKDLEVLEKVKQPQLFVQKYSIKTHDMFMTSELKLCKLTAYYVALYGQNFLNTILQQDNTTADFGFISSRHPQYTYFRQLIDIFISIISPSKEMLQELQYIHDSIDEYFEQICLHAFSIYKKARKEARDALDDEQERIAIQLIDWQDFTIVATLTFSPEEDIHLPEPENDIHSIQRAIMYRQMHALDSFSIPTDTKDDMVDIHLSKTIMPTNTTTTTTNNTVQIAKEEINSNKKVLNELQDTKKTLDILLDKEINSIRGNNDTSGGNNAFRLESVDEAEIIDETKQKELIQQGTIDSTTVQGQMLLQYFFTVNDTKLNTASSAIQTTNDTYYTCNYCGTMVESKNLEEHIRIKLLDPQWKEQKLLLEERRKETTVASAYDISQQVAQFNRMRKEVSDRNDTKQKIKTFETIITEQHIGPATSKQNDNKSISTSTLPNTVVDVSSSTVAGPAMQPPGGGTTNILPAPQILPEHFHRQLVGMPIAAPPPPPSSIVIIQQQQQQQQQQSFDPLLKKQRIETPIMNTATNAIKTSRMISPSSTTSTTQSFMQIPQSQQLSQQQQQQQQYQQQQRQQQQPSMPSLQARNTETVSTIAESTNSNVSNTTTTQLVPEQEWLTKYPQECNIKILFPTGGAPTNASSTKKGVTVGDDITKLFDNSTIVIHVPSLSITVNEFKTKVCDSIDKSYNIVPSKIKLRVGENIYLNKDALTLAHYNVPPDGTVVFGIRVRGGKK